MLTVEDFQTLGAEAQHNLYAQMHELYRQEKTRADILQTQMIDFFNESVKPILQKASLEQQPRVNAQEREQPRFTAKFLHIDSKNIIIGSSILARLPLNDIPSDIALHSYRGSTTEEKREIIKQYRNVHLKTVTLQDGTNALLKNKLVDVEQLFENYTLLVKEIQEKFTPEKFLLCEVLPLNNNDVSTDARIKQFNQLINDFAKGDENIEIVAFNAVIEKCANKARYYHDEIHMNDHLGMSTLKSLLLTALIPYSSGIRRRPTITNYQQQSNRATNSYHYQGNATNQHNSNAAHQYNGRFNNWSNQRNVRY